jgi:hypothetical protein
MNNRNLLRICPICGYNFEIVGSSVKNYEICPCCLFQYGIDDNAFDEFIIWREKWISQGMFFGNQNNKDNWRLEDVLHQLENLKFVDIHLYPLKSVIKWNSNWSPNYNREFVVESWNNRKKS